MRLMWFRNLFSKSSIIRPMFLTWVLFTGSKGYLAGKEKYSKTACRNPNFSLSYSPWAWRVREPASSVLPVSLALVLIESITVEVKLYTPVLPFSWTSTTWIASQTPLEKKKNARYFSETQMKNRKITFMGAPLRDASAAFLKRTTAAKPASKSQAYLLTWTTIKKKKNKTKQNQNLCPHMLETPPS